MFLAYSKGVVTVWTMGSFSSCPKFRHLLSNCLSSLSSLIISRLCLIAIIKSIWIIPATQSSKTLQMTTITTTTRRRNLPTLVLKTSLRFVLDHHRLVFLHIETLFLLLKQKDTIRRHAKWHAPDFEYVVFCGLFILLLKFNAFFGAKNLPPPWKGCDFTTFLKSNFDSGTIYRICSTFISINWM